MPNDQYGTFASGMNAMGPVSAYGYNQAGQMSYGPYSFLPGAPGQPAPGSQGSTSIGGFAQPSVDTQNAQSFLNGVVNGNNLPYSQQQQDSLYSSASASNAQAEQEQNNQARQQAAAGGASATDPSLSSVTQQNQARRQGANQTALGDIQSQANSANFGAQAGAATGLMNAGIQQQGLAERANEFGQNLGFQQSQSAMRMLGGQGSYQGYGPQQSGMGIYMGGSAF